jgi:drug/metabolite transporter (DMT)-like permease
MVHNSSQKCERRNNISHGAAGILIGIALLAAMDAVAKWLVIDGIGALQILAVRSVIIVIALLLIFSTRKRLAELRPTRPWAQALRGITGIIAPLTFFAGLKYLPLTDAVVTFFTSAFAITIVSALCLRERVGVHRWSAVVVGYIGVVIAMAPSGGGNLIGYVLVLIASVSYAGLFASGRWLTETESVSSLVFSYNAGTGLVACLLMPLFWSSMDGSDWLLLCLLSVLAVCGHFAMTYAFSVAEASSIAPFEYSALLWAILFDYVLWGTAPLPTTLVGAVIIVASALYVLRRERINQRAGE